MPVTLQEHHPARGKRENGPQPIEVHGASRVHAPARRWPPADIAVNRSLGTVPCTQGAACIYPQGLVRIYFHARRSPPIHGHTHLSARAFLHVHGQTYMAECTCPHAHARTRLPAPTRSLQARPSPHAHTRAYPSARACPCPPTCTSIATRTYPYPAREGPCPPPCTFVAARTSPHVNCCKHPPHACAHSPASPRTDLAARTRLHVRAHLHTLTSTRAPACTHLPTRITAVDIRAHCPGAMLRA
ncbi:hypothetical protein K438DRAFT_2000542 [Mycena galopus ATCC 62051]|nr:hypothetical protein K438DRAFT_2000542 [Mycena galopus ATCC 62051]